jgi:endonuclease/exonuclease/phosphatase family metal-dependent hydrolase
LFSFGLMGVSLTERAAILARTDLPTSQLQLTNPQQGGYQAFIPVRTLNGTIPIGSGWLSVDAQTRGKTFRFITTHLSAVTLTTGVQSQQMQELLAAPAATNLDVILAGDFNSPPTSPAPSAYSEAVGAHFTDAWATAHPLDPGFTASQVLPTINNPTSQLFVRIDDVLARGLFVPLDVHLVGADPSARTPSGLWPADHAGVVATIGMPAGDF